MPGRASRNEAFAGANSTFVVRTKLIDQQAHTRFDGSAFRPITLLDEFMCSHLILQIIAAAIMALGVGLVLFERIKNKKGLGARAIQLVAIIMIVPTILILALADALSKETTSTLIAALIGYVLSGIGEFKPEKSAKSEDNAANKHA